ncbi:MAG: riboflavin biosynthesis protein RibF [Clostridia bacterium]|nr:riboflavin biosynthesis protein RibF [Clostridia bacterium]
MTLYDLNKGSEIKSIDLPLSLVLGNFDGLHLGHAELLKTAKKTGNKVCVFTFTQNPFCVPSIISFEEKLRLLKEMGADYCAAFDFEKIKSLPWQTFVDTVLIETLPVKTAVCGFNFRFGANAEGDCEKLKDYLTAKGLDCIIAPAFLHNGDVVSSSRIRNLLSLGKVEEAAVLLGRNYTMEYKVCHGNRIGTKLGFPTINFSAPKDRVMLAKGVYTCRCMGLPAVTNFGVRPTVTTDTEPVYETFILDYNSDLYEKTVKVEFLRMQRAEMKFDSEQALREKIAEDVESAREYFNKTKNFLSDK